MGWQDLWGANITPVSAHVKQPVGSQVECPSYVAARMSSRGGVLPRGGARAERTAAGYGSLPSGGAGRAGTT